MANNFDGITPTELIAPMTARLLRRKSGMLGRVYTETIQENKAAGGSTVQIEKPHAVFTPTNVSYSSAAAAQDITIPTATLTFGYHKEIKVKATELESRTTQGNWKRALMNILESSTEGLAREIDGSLTALYSSASASVGTGGSALTDATVRSAAGTLAANGVDMMSDNVTLIVDAGTYYDDLMGIDKYVLANQSGSDETLRGGRIPKVYEMAVDYSQNIKNTTTSSVTTQHGIMFDRYAAVIGFMEFNPATEFSENAAVEEMMFTDPGTGVAMRVQKYYDASLRTGFWQMDVKWGVAVFDANRMIEIKS